MSFRGPLPVSDYTTGKKMEPLVKKLCEVEGTSVNVNEERTVRGARLIIGAGFADLFLIT